MRFYLIPGSCSIDMNLAVAVGRNYEPRWRADRQFLDSEAHEVLVSSFLSILWLFLGGGMACWSGMAASRG